MWRLDSDGKISNYNNDFPIVSTILVGGLGLIISIVWFVIWAVKTWGISGLFGGIIAVCGVYCFFSWASYRMAHRQWRVDKVKQKMNEAK